MPKSQAPTLVYHDLDSIKLATRNAKDHDIGAIIQSLNRFGFVAPCILNRTTGRLVVGHGRVEALRQMKAEGEVAPPVRVHVKGKKWEIPVIEVEFATDAEAEAYLIADNRITELGGWDYEELLPMLSDLATSEEISLEVTGFDHDDLSTFDFWHGESGSHRPPLPDPPAISGEGRVPATRIVLLFDSAAEVEDFWSGINGEPKAGKMTFRWSELGFATNE